MSKMCYKLIPSKSGYQNGSGTKPGISCENHIRGNLFKSRWVKENTI